MKRILFIATLLMAFSFATPNCSVSAQDTIPAPDTNSAPEPITPFDSAAPSPCPQVLIEQKYDHVPATQYRQLGWDTVVTASQQEITLSSEPVIPVQFFNGTYAVTQIPYNPTVPSFHLDSIPNCHRMLHYADDMFQDSAQNIPFPFYFFGIRKDKFVVGDNGLITFNPDAARQRCSFNTKPPIPWPDTVQGFDVNCHVNHHRDAIYGVYQDIEVGPQYCSGTQGIWYGIIGEWPCRKIVASFNGAPFYPGSSNLTNRQTYQIVCYEGTNIVEVHIKRRHSSLTNVAWGKWGLIGIQNATGLPQMPGTPGHPNCYVFPGSPAAFWPAGANPLTEADQIDSVSYRFTPQGNTPYTFLWYRLTADGDSIPLSTTPGDPNGWYEPMNQYDPLHPRLTRAHVSPSEPTRYVAYLYFLNAEGEKYRLRDTIFVGIDTGNVAIDTIGIHRVDMNVAGELTLAPNPASGEVLVTSQHYMTRIEMHNSRGILVYSEPTSGHEHRLSLDGLPAGSYIVSVQTTAGSTAKRLAVQ